MPFRTSFGMLGVNIRRLIKVLIAAAALVVAYFASATLNFTDSAS